MMREVSHVCFLAFSEIAHVGLFMSDLAPRLYFSCSTQLRLKFILLINVKMPTIVGILIL